LFIDFFPYAKKNCSISYVNLWDHPQAKLYRLTGKSRISADFSKQYLKFLFYSLKSMPYRRSAKTLFALVWLFSAKYVNLIRNTTGVSDLY